MTVFQLASRFPFTWLFPFSLLSARMLGCVQDCVMEKRLSGESAECGQLRERLPLNPCLWLGSKSRGCFLFLLPEEKTVGFSEAQKGISLLVAKKLCRLSRVKLAVTDENNCEAVKMKALLLFVTNTLQSFQFHNKAIIFEGTC